MNSVEEILNNKIADLSKQVESLEFRLNEAHNIFNFHLLPVIISGSDNQVKLANEQALKLFNAEADQVYSDDFLNQLFRKPELKKWTQQTLNIQTNQRVNYETVIHPINKSALHIDVISIKMIYKGSDCVLSYLRNITDQKNAEQNYRHEHESYQRVLDAIPAMIFIKDAQSRVISVNKTFEEITGLKKADILGKRLFELSENQDIIEKYWKDDLEVIETGVAKRNIIEPLFTDPDRWFITDKIPFLTNDGIINGIIGFSIDVTERKHAEEALIRSEKKFRGLFNTAPDGIMVGNLEGDFYSANKAYLDMLGYTMPELLNKKYEDIVPAKWIGPIEATIESLKNDGRTGFVMEMEHYKKDGTVFPVMVSAWIMVNESKGVTQLGAYVKDLTVIKKAELLEKELLQKDKEQLERDLEAKNRELNTKVTQLIETNELVNGVISKLKDAIKIGDEDKNRQIQFIINDLTNHGNEDLWLQFEITFGQIHSSFYNDLYAKYPKLTPNERKLCAFLKMNLSTKDISSITHQTIRSIEVARFRLRTKMNLPRSTNLPKFLSNF
jgi:PAS domain S-box-containing protein